MVSRIPATYLFFNLENIIETWSDPYQNIQYFIRSKNIVLNFITVRYSLHKCSDTILC